MAKGNADKMGYYWDRETSVHDVNGKKFTQQQRRARMIKSLKQEIHLHETWSGKMWQWRTAIKKTRLCGTDACIRATRKT